ncbi:unnamed protein product [Heterotrigona itama]|uniref:Uncharacterized protein n=1 Tax=Heterotrigona itama TaxID=395501 RepID=A0A6V7HC83_9HYME|nr:unnamed protein product [Heterotrigona itama]
MPNFSCERKRASLNNILETNEEVFAEITALINSTTMLHRHLFNFRLAELCLCKKGEKRSDSQASWLFPRMNFHTKNNIDNPE